MHQATSSYCDQTALTLPTSTSSIMVRSRKRTSSSSASVASSSKLPEPSTTRAAPPPASYMDDEDEDEDELMEAASSGEEGPLVTYEPDPLAGLEDELGEDSEEDEFELERLQKSELAGLEHHTKS